MIRNVWSIVKWCAAGAMSLLLLSSSFALAQVDSTTVDGLGASDHLRTGGCTGCFQTQVTAALANFKEVKRVFRICATGGTIPNDNKCDAPALAGNGKFGDFIMLQGDLRNSTTDPNGLGIPGGATDVTYRISANGSGNGFLCSRASGPGNIGFIAPEGFDGVPTGTDNAGGGAFGVPGPGRATGGGPATGGPNDEAPKLTECAGTLNQFPKAGDLILPPANKELCIVNVDQGAGNGAINNDTRGAAAPGAITTLGQLELANETTNLILSCDLGFGDLPPADFADPNTSTQVLKNQDVFGAQIFKLIVSKDVHASTGLTKKLQLSKPQIENIFGPSTATNVCSIANLGAVSTAGTGTPDDLRVCYRAAGSGSREVYRNTFSANTVPGGSHAIGEGSPITTTICPQKDINGVFLSPPPKKTLHRNASTGDVVTCIENNPRSIGYVEADRQNDLKFYSPVVEGIDVDAHPTTLKDLVRCGLYRYWGPLAGGEGPRTAALTPDEVAHRKALKTQIVFASTAAYLPLNGVAFTKTNTDTQYTLQFAPTACPGEPNAPLPIP